MVVHLAPHRPASERAALLLLREVLERDVERVVQRGGAAGLGAVERRLQGRVVGGEVLEDGGAVVGGL